MVLELLAVASLVQQWQEVRLEAILLSLLLTRNQEDPSLLVKEEEAKSLEGKGQRERSVNFTDPTGLYGLDSAGYSMGPGNWSYVPLYQPVILIQFSGQTNLNNASVGSASVFSMDRVYKTSDGHVAINRDNPSATVPIVSGGGKSPVGISDRIADGVYPDRATVKTGTSTNDVLYDADHGGPENTYIPFLTPDGKAVHQGNNRADQTTAYSQGCPVVTTTDLADKTPAENYNSVKQAVNNQNSTTVVETSKPWYQFW
jgi:hypothetical protein